MNTNAIIKAIVAAGATPEVITAALDAFEAMDRERKAEVAARKAKSRARKGGQDDDVTECHAMSRDMGGLSRDTLPPAPSPQTPQPHPPTRVSISTGARGQPKSNGFARFWEAYPNKTGKGAAAKAYDKALARIAGPDPPGVLLAALERVKPTWRDRQFIPNPTTWLNQDRWEDQPETVVPLDVRRSDRPASAPDRKLEERHDNYRRAFAGAVRAAQNGGV